MSVLKFSINEAKSNFFLDQLGNPKQGVQQLMEDELRGLSKWGFDVRRAVKRTLKKRRKKTLAEMTSAERQRYKIERQILKSGGKLWGGRTKPFKPSKPSEPGEPPRMILGLIKKFMYYAYDKEQRSVVVGPAIIDNPTGAPETLEEGGYVQFHGHQVRIAPRPYMKPIFDEYYPKLPMYLAGQAW